MASLWDLLCPELEEKIIQFRSGQDRHEHYEKMKEVHKHVVARAHFMVRQEHDLNDWMDEHGISKDELIEMVLDNI